MQSTSLSESGLSLKYTVCLFGVIYLFLTQDVVDCLSRPPNSNETRTQGISNVYDSNSTKVNNIDRMSMNVEEKRGKER